MLNEALAASAHIVVCDDEPDIRDTLAEYLEGNGYTVTPADAGPALRKLIDAQAETDGPPIDLVILDLRMPGEDGLSLARYLREHSDVAIIMLTGSADTIDRVVGLEVGADDYVAKPVDLRELLARVKAVLRRTAGRKTKWRESGNPRVRSRRSSALAASCRRRASCSTPKAPKSGSRRWSSSS